jgi:hypothetical protein
MSATTLTVPDLSPFIPDLQPAKADAIVREIVEAAAQFDEGAYAGIFADEFTWPQSAKAVLRDAAIRRYNSTGPGRVDPAAVTALFLDAELFRLNALLASGDRVQRSGALPLGSFPPACPVRW